MSAGPEMPPNLPQDDRDLRAAEYVLGTASGQERAAFEAEIARDASAAATVRAWEKRLAPIGLAIPEESPSARVWERIEGRLSPAPSAAQSAPAPAAAANDNRVAVLTRQVRRWRMLSAGFGLIAAGLALAIGVGPRLWIQPEPSRFVAVVNSAGEAPALIVSVDTARGTAQVRSLAAQTPPGKSLELWYVGAGKPQSLGVLRADSSRVGLPAGAAGGEGAFAVSVEPAGGSQTGQPTGQVIYQGKLVRE